MTSTSLAPRRANRALLYAVGAALVSLLVWNIPGINLILYPFRLFVTLIHEGGHALATLVTGGQVDSIFLAPDGSGVTFSRGGWAPVIASAGYIGAAAYGALLFVLLRHSQAGRRALYVSAGVTLLFTLLFVRNVFGVVVGLGLAVALGTAGRYLPPPAALFLSAFLAVQLSLNALLDLLGLVFATGLFPIGHNDAVIMSQLIPLPPILWAVLWSVLSAMIVWWGIRGLWQSSS